jgi:hypothetical protein
VSALTHGNEASAEVFSNRKPIPGAIPLPLTSSLEECMPVWAAARSTSAAFPYFKSFQWRGQTLLDGGFKLNCPAAVALSEAKSIWPEKRCDIMLSLGTGKGTIPGKPSSHASVYGRLIKDITESLLNTEDIWNKFIVAIPQQVGIFRINPVYSGAGYELDDFRQLDKIQREIEGWLDTRDHEIVSVCDQLVSALFYFVPNGLINKGEQTGTILCRLPVDLVARQSLLDGMRQQEDMNIFSVQFVGIPRDDIPINVLGSLKAVRSGDELRIPVRLRNLPETGTITIQIQMRSLFGGRSSFTRGSQISGSPYVCTTWRSEPHEI